MKRVTLIPECNTKRARAYLKKIEEVTPGKGLYIAFGEVSEEIKHKIMEKGFVRFENTSRDDAFKSKFMREYLDLIGRMGKENDKLEWWATDIASKNRFTSFLPHLLQQFMTVIEAMENEKYDELVILSPAYSIILSLKKAIEGKGMLYKCMDYTLKKYLQSISGFFHALGDIVFNGMRTYLRSLYARIKINVPVKNESYNIIKTFIYDSSFSSNGEYNDAFFGRLPEHLKEKGDLLIFACILGGYIRNIRRINACQEYKMVPVEAFLSFFDILTAVFRRLFLNIKVPQDISFFGYKADSIVRSELKRTFNGVQFYHYLHYWSTRRLLGRIKVSSFYMTYESNPWEKMCIQAIREVSPASRIIGYQHTIVSQASANMFINRYEKDIIPSPDRILTVGDVPKDIIRKYGDYNEDTIQSSCGLRFGYLFDAEVQRRKKGRNILIALEGIKEVYKLVSYIFKQLGNTDYTVMIRTHPVLGWEYFKKEHGLDIDSYSNFSVSTGRSLKEDFDWADMVVYWGSTVAVEALNMGLPVIHFEMDSILSYDPLFECDYLKWSVEDKDTLKDTIDGIYRLSDNEYDLEQEKAREYLRRYFLPVNEERMERFVNV